ncbi:tetratricopeptide repeat protein [Limnospira platensis]|uniref:tetratricopeptide repeat protein n=1 Tax=Limnospira platensis TaxID=118562 RepID=UPI003D6DB057
MTGRWVSSLLTVSLLLGMGSLSPWVEAQTVLVQGRMSAREVGELLLQGAQQTQQGRPVQAIETLERVLEAARQLQDRELEALALLGIGRNYYQIGQRQQALELSEQALILFRETNNRFGEGTTLNNIGAVYNALGNRTEALNYYNQALPITREVGDRSGEATTLSNIASVYRDTNQPDKAITHWEDSLNILLSLRSELQKEFRETFLQTNRGPAVALVDILIDQNQPQRAFEWANRFTTYELADYNRLIGVRVANPEAQAALDDRKIGYKPRPLA